MSGVCFRHALWWYRHGVSWSLLAIPASLALTVALLALSALVEQRVLSPRSMIVSAARARRTGPEYTEAIVAREFERLLRNSQR